MSTTLSGSWTDLAGGRTALRIEDVFATTVEDLWSAATDPERLGRWLVTVTGDLRVGGEVTARFTSGWEGPGRIEVCDAPHRLLVTMSPGADDQTTIEATLTADGARTRLVVVESGLPAGDVPYHAAGWQVHLEDLATHLTGARPAAWEPRWRALTPPYLELAAS